MTTCLDLFRSYIEDNAAIPNNLDDCFPNFYCESQTCSQHSPCIVDNNEQVAFLLIDPLHYDEERKVVVPDAFSELTSRDLSVVRIAFASKQEVESTKKLLIDRGVGKIPPQSRSVDQVCLAYVSMIREAKIDADRLMGVYDTALPQQPSHASIVILAKDKTQKLRRKRIRESIHRIMTKEVVSFEGLIQSI